jgi:chromosome segregation ATPase
MDFVDVAGLEEELEEHNGRIGILTQQSQTLTEQYEEMHQQYEEQKAEMDSEKDKTKETLDKLEQIKDGIERLAQTVSAAKGHQNHYEQKLNELMENIAGCQREVDAMETRATESTRKAEMICERIETQKTVKELESKLNQIERVIAEEEQRQGSREEIVTTYHELSLRYAETKKSIRSLQLCLTRLSDMMTKRVKQLQDYRHSVAIRIKILFQLLLQQRGYNGKMTFDHSTQELKLEVRVSETEKGSVTKDMKALSGGERSFTTVCFILSLWGIIESPFRMLDEFDVFMDMVNRRVSMAMLLKAAREHLNKQFVFLTPQDLSAHIGAPDVRTHLLHDPERHQSTLNFHSSGNS